MPNTEHFHVERDGPLFVISPMGELGGLAGDCLPFEVDELLGEMERKASHAAGTAEFHRRTNIWRRD